jgi:hypothetical protein
VLLVLGMHRSGTSAITRVLNLLGFEVGADLEPAAKGNEKGLWEHAGIVSIHERVLRTLGLMNWDDPGPLPDGWERVAQLEAFRDELAALLRESFAADAPVVVKDPRMCRLTPLWWPVLDRLKRRAVCVLSLRHPLEVAESLALRSGLSPRHSHLLWLRHVLEAEAATRNRSRVVIPYTRFLDDWRGSLAGLRAALGGEFPRPSEEVASEIDDFLDRSLCHHRFRDDGEWRASARDVPWIAAAYDGMAGLVGRDDAESRRSLVTVHRSFASADRLFGEVRHAAPVGAGTPTTGADDVVMALVERWDHGKLGIRGTSGELVAGRMLEAEVVPRHPNFCGLELLIGTHKRTNTCTLCVQVLDAGGEVVGRQQVGAHTLTDNGWFMTRFMPQAGSSGNTYRVRVTSPDASEGNAVSIYCGEDDTLIYRAYYGAPSPDGVRVSSRSAAAGRASPFADSVARIEARLAEMRRLFERAGEARAREDVARSGRLSHVEDACTRTTTEVTRLAADLERLSLHVERLVDGEADRERDRERADHARAEREAASDERLSRVAASSAQATAAISRLAADVRRLATDVERLVGLEADRDQRLGVEERARAEADVARDERLAHASDLSSRTAADVARISREVARVSSDVDRLVERVAHHERLSALVADLERTVSGLREDLVSIDSDLEAGWTAIGDALEEGGRT